MRRRAASRLPRAEGRLGGCGGGQLRGRRRCRRRQRAPRRGRGQRRGGRWRCGQRACAGSASAVACGSVSCGTQGSIEQAASACKGGRPAGPDRARFGWGGGRPAVCGACSSSPSGVVVGAGEASDTPPLAAEACCCDDRVARAHWASIGVAAATCGARARRRRTLAANLSWLAPAGGRSSPCRRHHAAGDTHYLLTCEEGWPCSA